jgi:hypothetical protein
MDHNSRSIIGRFEFVLRTRVAMFGFNFQYFLSSIFLFLVFSIFLRFQSLVFVFFVLFYFYCSVFFVK